MTESKKAFLLIEKFKAAVEAVGDGMVIHGEVCFVENLTKGQGEEIKKIGSLYMTSGGNKQITAYDSHPPVFVRVLAVGVGFYDDETKKDVPLKVKPGDIALTGRYAPEWFSCFGAVQGSKVGFARASELERVTFSSQEDYEKFMGYFDDPELVGA